MSLQVGVIAVGIALVTGTILGLLSGYVGGMLDNWLMRRESSALAATTCRRDWLPSVGPMELTSELPFLALAS